MTTGSTAPKSSPTQPLSPATVGGRTSPCVRQRPTPTTPEPCESRVGSVQQARDALGLRLRELRLDARLSGRQLAERLAWPASKVSKIELGRQTPTESDIHAWADATAARNAAPDLIASLRTLETLYAEWRRQFRTGARARQLSILQLETSVSVIRAFEPALIPGLL